ncbi:hypothetical protein [Paenibacillus illinoisensis]|uniref:hypothetical protein n=1 Tax=Paenibacillus illinoisensis TaxID=59845 RepID=UPI003016F134
MSHGTQPFYNEVFRKDQEHRQQATMKREERAYRLRTLLNNRGDRNRVVGFRVLLLLEKKSFFRSASG